MSEMKKKLYELLIDYLAEDKNILQVFNMGTQTTHDVVDAKIVDGVIQLIIQPRFADEEDNNIRLRYSAKSELLARDRTKNRVLLGGLGAMGVGEAWFEDDGKYKYAEGYDDLPEQKSFMWGDKE